MRVDGQCHCGRIAYVAEVDPEQVYLCHCEDCQSISGGAGRWAASVAVSDFRLIRGETRAYVKRSAAGTESHQHFCAHCASPIYSTAPHKPEMVRLRVGTANQRGDLPPRAEVWVRSAQPWALTARDTKKLDRQ
ncbi:MAG: GFA family protein [Pseudomonadota bacterium]